MRGRVESAANIQTGNIDEFPFRNTFRGKIGHFDELHFCTPSTPEGELAWMKLRLYQRHQPEKYDGLQDFRRGMRNGMMCSLSMSLGIAPSLRISVYSGERGC